MQQISISSSSWFDLQKNHESYTWSIKEQNIIGENQSLSILTWISINKFSQHDMSAIPVQQTRVLIFISFINSHAQRVLDSWHNTNGSNWISPRILYCIYSHVFTTMPPWKKEMLEFSVGQLFHMRSMLANFPGMLRFHLGFISEGQYFKHEKRR